MSYQFYQRDPLYASHVAGGGGRSHVTRFLLILNVLIWAAMSIAGGSEDPDVLLRFGAMFGPFIADGQYWRLFTAIFLHVGLLHLLFNAFGLFVFGRMVERIYGHTRFALIYLLAGMGGSVLSYLLNSVAIGAGASGAIFGVLGALAAFFVAKRDVLGEMGRQNLTGIAVMVVINLFFGFVSPGIDNWAHMGGLVVGFGVGYAFVPNHQMLRDPVHHAETVVDRNPLSRTWWVVPVTLGVLAFGTLLGTSTLPDNPVSHVQRAYRHLEQERYEDALVDAAAALRLDPLYGEAYYVRGVALYEQGDLSRARSNLSAALRLGLDDARGEQAADLLLELSADQ